MDRPTLPRALACAAAQTHPELEIVVVAACGSGHRPLPPQWEGRPLRLVRHASPLDRAAAANSALDGATGDWLNFLDDDDELLPQHVQTLLDARAQAGSARVIYGRTLVVDDAGHTMKFGWKHVPLDLLEGSRFHMQAALFHRSLPDSGARFDVSLPVHEDLDFWIQCSQRTEFAFVDRFTNRWHAFIGTSGAGGGANLDTALVHATQCRLHAKWVHLVPAWAGALELAAVIERGRSALQANYPVLARALLEHALAREPANANALNLAGVANLQCGDAPRAASLLRAALAALPDNPVLLKNLRLAEEAMPRAPAGTGEPDGGPTAARS